MIAIAKQFETGHQVPPDWECRFRPMLKRIATIQLRDEQLAEDVVQNTLLAAFCSVEQFRGDATFGAWLVAILRRKIVDAQRKAISDTRLVSGYYEDQKNTCDTQSVDQQMLLEETWSLLSDEIKNLPQGQASVVRLVCFDGMSTRSVATALGITVGNVWVRLHRARTKIRSRLIEEQHVIENGRNGEVEPA